MEEVSNDLLSAASREDLPQMTLCQQENDTLPVNISVLSATVERAVGFGDTQKEVTKFSNKKTANFR